jgi:hypothetical protein
MDRVTIAALVVACASVILSVVLGHDAEQSAGHALLLVVPLALIAFPDAIEAGVRHSFRGTGHGGQGPTPGCFIRVAAWGLLVVLVIVHHTLGFARVPARRPNALRAKPPLTMYGTLTPRLLTLAVGSGPKETWIALLRRGSFRGSRAVAA